MRVVPGQIVVRIGQTAMQQQAAVRVAGTKTVACRFRWTPSAVGQNRLLGALLRNAPHPVTLLGHSVWEIAPTNPATFGRLTVKAATPRMAADASHATTETPRLTRGVMTVNLTADVA